QVEPGRVVGILAGGAAAPASAVEQTFDQDAQVERAVVASLAAVGVMLVMTVIGLAIYLIALRGRSRRPEPQTMTPPDTRFQRPPRDATTGSMRPVQPQRHPGPARRIFEAVQMRVQLEDGERIDGVSYGVDAVGGFVMGGIGQRVGGVGRREEAVRRQDTHDAGHG
ncbi:MAG: hypothetical protein ACOCZH_04710, partial [Phototrophicaceae bacterium]